MQLNDAGNTLSSRPTPNATVSPGYCNNNVSGGSAATVLDPDWVNAVSAELISVLTAASISPSKSSVNQLLTALEQLFGFTRNETSWTAHGTYTWTVPSGVYRVKARVWGAGGGGAAASSSGNGAGGGGGGGGYSEGWFSVTPGANITVTVGQAGTGGSGYQANGTAATASSFGSYCSANGGSYGTWGSSSSPGNGGAGGSATGGQINLPGQGGSQSHGYNYGTAGEGGGTAMGAKPGWGTVYGLGGGGSGSEGGNIGSDGSDGTVILEW